MDDEGGRGPKVPGYERFERIGSGGFSTVYRAYEPKFDRVVAIKILSLAVSDPNAQRRFIRECQLMGRLGSHPHVLTVFASDVLDDDRPYIVMEYLEGGTSSERAPLPEAEVLRTGVLVGSALASIHAAGVVHRDVKPHNVLLSGYGQPVLGDFGVSGVIQQDGSVSNPMALSPLYAAPEAFSGLPTAASDQYSFGATLYALLADRSPVEADPEEPLTRIMLRAVEDTPPPLPPDVAGPGTWAVLQRALAKDPAERFASVADMVGALQDVQEALGLPVTAGVGGSVEARPARPPGGSARVPTHRPLGGGPPTPAPPTPPAPAGTGDTRPAAWPDPVVEPEPGAAAPPVGPPPPAPPPDSTRALPGGGAPPPPVDHRPSGDGAPAGAVTRASADEGTPSGPTPTDPAPRRRGALLPVLVLVVVGLVLGLVVMVVLQTGTDATAPPTTTAVEVDPYPVGVLLTLAADDGDGGTLEWEPVPGADRYLVVAFDDLDPGSPQVVGEVDGTRTEVQPAADPTGTCYLVRALTGADIDVEAIPRTIDPDACTPGTTVQAVGAG